MPPVSNADLRGFHAFLGDKLRNGGADITPEDALDEWRQSHPDSEEDDVAAIQAALDDIANGEQGVPLSEFDREFRKEQNIPDL